MVNVEVVIWRKTLAAKSSNVLALKCSCKQRRDTVCAVRRAAHDAVLFPQTKYQGDGGLEYKALEKRRVLANGVGIGTTEKFEKVRVSPRSCWLGVHKSFPLVSLTLLYRLCT